MLLKTLSTLAAASVALGAVTLDPAYAAPNSTPTCHFTYTNGNKVIYTFMDLQGGDVAETGIEVNDRRTIHPRHRLPRWSFTMGDGYAVMRYKADMRYKILWSADKSEIERISDVDFTANLAPATMLRDGAVIARGRCGFVTPTQKRDPNFADVTGNE